MSSWLRQAGNSFSRAFTPREGDAGNADGDPDGPFEHLPSVVPGGDAPPPEPRGADTSGVRGHHPVARGARPRPPGPRRRALDRPPEVFAACSPVSCPTPRACPVCSRLASRTTGAPRTCSSSSRRRWRSPSAPRSPRASAPSLPPSPYLSTSAPGSAGFRPRHDRRASLGGEADPEDETVSLAREAAEEDAAAEAATFRFLSSCSLDFRDRVPDGFYVPWGEYPEVELTGEYRVPPLALLESIEPDASDDKGGCRRRRAPRRGPSRVSLPVGGIRRRRRR